MTTPKNPLTSRTFLTGAAMLGAAFIVFSLNQGGLTGRATGGAVGCGGYEPVAESSQSLGDSPLLQPSAPDDEIVLRRDPPMFVPNFRLAADGRSIERFVAVAQPSEEGPGLEPAADPREVGVPPIRIEVDRASDLWTRMQNDGLTVWADLIETARLRDVFEDGQAAFTVFVPSNEALESFPAELREGENIALLQAVIRHHMVPGRYPAEALPGHFMPTALAEQPVFRSAEDVVEGSKDGSARIVQPNRETDTGMVHVVDGVLWPHYTLPILLQHQGYALFGAMLEVSGHLSAVSDPETPMTVLAISDTTIAAAGIEIDHIESGLNGFVRSVVENHIVYGAWDSFVGEDGFKTLSNMSFATEDDARLHFSNGVDVSVTLDGSAENGPIWEAKGIIDAPPVN